MHAFPIMMADTLEAKLGYSSKFKASAHITFIVSLAETNHMAKSHWLTLMEVMWQREYYSLAKKV